MENQFLKNVLMKEHSRDKRLTFIAYGLVVLIALIILSAAFYFLWGRIGDVAQEGANTAQNLPTYLKFVLPITLLCGIGWIVKSFINLNKRPLKIDALFLAAGPGKKASEITSHTVYKIIIPLGKITYKMCPVNYLSFSFDGKIYDLPVPVGAEPDLKTLLSGADMEKVNEIWADLYGDNTTETTTTDTLKPVQEFKAFAETELFHKVKGMESGRKKTATMTIVLTVGILVLFFGFIAFNFMTHQESDNTQDGQWKYTYKILIGFGVLCAIIYAGYIPYMKKQTRAMAAGESYTEFKEKVFKKIIAFINPSFQYVEHGHLGLADIRDAQIFRDIFYDISGNDQILGRYNGVPFQYCDLSITHKAKFTKENEGPDEVFTGQFFMAKFNKSFNTRISVCQKSGLKEFFTDNSMGSYVNRPGDKIMLEDPEFMKLFDINADDQLEARYILTPTVMQSIKEMAAKTKEKLNIFFTNNRIVVANNSRENKFETGMFTSITPDLVVSFYEDLCKQFSIIDDLKLNINIWNRKS